MYSSGDYASHLSRSPRCFKRRRPDIESLPTCFASTGNKTISRKQRFSHRCRQSGCFLGLSEADVLTPALIKSMNQDPIIFALANPKPEIEPDLAQANGVRLLATGSSKYPNQVNNILAFPGLFKGLLAAKGRKVDVGLQMTVARSLAAMISEPTAEKFIPNVFDGGVVDTVLMLY